MLALAVGSLFLGGLLSATRSSVTWRAIGYDLLIFGSIAGVILVLRVWRGWAWFASMIAAIGLVLLCLGLLLGVLGLAVLGTMGVMFLAAGFATRNEPSPEEGRAL